MYSFANNGTYSTSFYDGFLGFVLHEISKEIKKEQKLCSHSHRSSAKMHEFRTFPDRFSFDFWFVLELLSEILVRILKK